MIDGEDDGFFGPRAVPEADKIGGLVVGPRARLIYDKAGEPIWDELALMERDYIRAGKPPIIFATADGNWEEDRRSPDAQAAKWQAIMGLDRLPTVAEAEEHVRRWNAPAPP